MAEEKFITGYFTEEKELFAAIRKLQGEGMNITDVRTPFPVHGLDKLLKFKTTNISFIAFVSGVIGLAVGMGIQYLVSTKFYPINYGGKPFFAFPAFMPVTVMLTFLFAAFGAVFGFLFQARLGAGAPAWIPDEDVSDDRFLIIIGSGKNDTEVIQCLESTGARDVKTVIKS